MNIDEFMAVGTGNITIEEYLKVLSSANAVPGGGGASGVVASLGAALGAMVCNLTSGKKKYAEYQDEIEMLTAKCEELRDRLLDEADEDAVCFKPLSEAYGLPKTTEDEAAYRDKVLNECLERAAKAPLEMMKTIGEILVILNRLSVIGSKLAISDVGVGAKFCVASTYTSSLNVFINTKLMKNRELAESINSEALALIDKNSKIGEEAFDRVFAELKS